VNLLKSGHVTITRSENLHIFIHICIHIEKFTDSKNAILFDLRRNINEIIAEKPFQNSGVTRHLWHFQHATVLERSIEVGFSFILSIYKVVYISILNFCMSGMRQCIGEICCQICQNADLDWSKLHE